jgi:hypothetical protein
VRTHIILSDSLITEIDRLVGKRKRSRFVEEAVREELKKRVLLNELKNIAGVLSSGEYPDWETPDMTAAWVRELRQRDEERRRFNPISAFPEWIL